MSSPNVARKRNINSFFTPSQPAKRARIESPPPSAPSVTQKKTIPTPAPSDRSEIRPTDDQVLGTNADPEQPSSIHTNYPHPIRALPPALLETLMLAPPGPAKHMNSNPDLDCLYYTPYIPPSLQKPLFKFLRSELPFYRVKYNIKRGTMETEINTPRYTTVYGVDETSAFADPSEHDSGAAKVLLDASTHKPCPASAYKCRPRPIPACLDSLRLSAEAATGHSFNFVLVNYYANGTDSISYHSDDERFLGPDPCIASFSLGAARDFLLRHKNKNLDPKERDLKLKLESGDMILMRGTTQSKWLHSLPKRAGKQSGEQGRVNITLRKAMAKGGTENYYRYNVGEGEVYRWSKEKRDMVVWKGDCAAGVKS